MKGGVAVRVGDGLGFRDGHNSAMKWCGIKYVANIVHGKQPEFLC
jgi:hypothetical protein